MPQSTQYRVPGWPWVSLQGQRDSAGLQSPGQKRHGSCCPSLGILCQERACHSGRHLSALQVPCDRGHATCVWGAQGNECSTRASASRHPGPGHTCGQRSLPIPQPSLDCSLQGEMSCSRSSDGTIFVLTAPSQMLVGGTLCSYR